MNIHKQFHLSLNKVICTVMDNRSKFIKIFKQFNYNIQPLQTDKKELKYVEKDGTLHFWIVRNILSAANNTDK